MAFLKSKPAPAPTPTSPSHDAPEKGSFIMVAPSANVSSVGFGDRTFAIRADGTFSIPAELFEMAASVGLVLKD